MNTLRSLQVRIGQLRAKVRAARRGSPEQIAAMRDVQKLEAQIYRLQSN